MEVRHIDPLQLLTPEHTAGLLAVGVKTLMGWRKGTRGAPVRLPWLKIGHYVRYPVRGLLAYVRAHTLIAEGVPCPELWPDGCTVSVDTGGVPEREPVPLAFLTTADIAKRFGVCVWTVRRWRLPCTKVWRSKRYAVAAMAEVIRARTFTAGGKPCPEVWGDTPDAAIVAGPYLTTPEVETALALPERLALHWRAGRWSAVPLPFVKIGGRIRYPEPLLRAWVEANTRRPADGQARNRAKAGGQRHGQNRKASPKVAKRGGGPAGRGERGLFSAARGRA
jgi:hypothetical protein